METRNQLAINKILTMVAEYKASDLHLSVANPPILRVDGKLIALTDEPLLTPDWLATFIDSILNEEQKVILARDKEMVLCYDFSDKVRFKVNVFYQKGALSASLRYIPNLIRTIDELGLPAIVRGFTKLKKGLVLVTGPFGSGRTTTMASLVNEVNQERAEHIITIEKPIEYLFIENKSVIEQREVGKDTNSFTEALDAIREEDVNVVMVSEMETKEAIRMVLGVAEAGRLIFSVMSTDSVLKTIEKIINSFDQDEKGHIRNQLADDLEGIISQRLLPKAGGGMKLVAEVLIPTSAARSVIRDGAIYQLNNILQTSRGEGMISLDRSLAELVKAGEISLDDALAQAADPQNLKSIARR